MSVPDICAPRLDHDPYGPELADDPELAEPSVWGPMRRTARPVRWPGRTAGRVLVVVRFGAARPALWEPVTFSSAPDHPITTVRTRQSIPSDVDLPLRTVNRRLTCRARSPAWVREKEAVQRRASDGLIENFAARGATSSGRSCCRCRDFAEPRRPSPRCSMPTSTGASAAPHRIPRGARRVVAAEGLGLGDSFTAVGGDFFDAVPAADLHLLKLITYGLGRQGARVLRRNCATVFQGLFTQAGLELTTVTPPSSTPTVLEGRLRSCCPASASAGGGGSNLLAAITASWRDLCVTQISPRAGGAGVSPRRPP